MICEVDGERLGGKRIVINRGHGLESSPVKAEAETASTRKEIEYRRP